KHSQKLKRNIPAAFARHFREDRIQILASPATHPYMPLMLTDASLRGQLAAGMEISEKHLGRRPQGVWLPECAYRPASQQWQSTLLQQGSIARPGLETLFAELGFTHFIVDTHLIARGKPVAVIKADGIHATM